MGPDLRDLDGWKNIAAYLNVTPRAAQRWRRERGLPIHRMAGRIYAVREEIDEWVRKNDEVFREATEELAENGFGDNRSNGKESADSPLEPRRSRRWRSAAIALVSLTVAAAAVWWIVEWSRFGSQSSPAFAVDRVFGRAAAEGGRITTVSVGGRPGRVIVHPTRAEIYVLNLDLGVVSVLDAGRLAVIRTLHVGWKPADMVLDPNGRYLYAATHGEGLVRVDLESNERTVFREGLADGHIVSLAITQDARRLFVAVAQRGLKVMDLRSARIRTISSIACPYSLAIAPQGRYLYVGYQCGGPGGTRGHDTVEVFDLASEKPVRSLGGVPMVGGALAAPPGDLSLWASGSDACTQFYADGDQSGCPMKPGWVFHVFRPQDGLRVASVGSSIDRQFSRVVILPGGGKVLLLGAEPRVYDAASLTEVERFAPAALKYWTDAAVDPVRRQLVAVDGDHGRVQVVDLPASSCDPPWPGLWGHWPLDGSLTARVGELHAESSSGIRFASGMVGSAADLTAGGLLIRGVAEIHLLLFNVAPGTLAFWLKPLDAHGEIASFRTEQRLFDWTLRRTPSGSLRLDLDGVSALESRPIPGDRWTQVALVRTPERIELLVDGRLEASRAAASLPQIGNDERMLQFGPFAGFADEVVLYDHNLNPAELQAIDRTLRGCVASSN